MTAFITIKPDFLINIYIMLVLATFHVNVSYVFLKYAHHLYIYFLWLEVRSISFIYRKLNALIVK